MSRSSLLTSELPLAAGALSLGAFRLDQGHRPDPPRTVARARGTEQKANRKTSRQPKVEPPVGLPGYLGSRINVPRSESTSHFLKLSRKFKPNRPKPGLFGKSCTSARTLRTSQPPIATLSS